MVAKREPPWQPCERTGKKGYKTKLDVLTVLSHSSRTKAMKRAYRCPHCSRWHMTKRA